MHSKVQWQDRKKTSSTCFQQLNWVAHNTIVTEPFKRRFRNISSTRTPDARASSRAIAPHWSQQSHRVQAQIQCTTSTL